MKLQHRRKSKTTSYMPLGRRRPPYGLIVTGLTFLAGMVFLYVKEVPAPQTPVEIPLDAAKFTSQ
jgi:hypothetical protein